MMKTFTAWLDTFLEAHAPGTPFPRYADIALETGVSTRTVATGMKRAADAGQIITVRGKGAFIPGAPPAGKQRPERTTAAANLADELEQSIQDGSIRQGEALPAVKYMAATFHATGRTVMDAYRMLRKRGLVARMGSAWWVGRPRELVYPPRRNEVYLFRYGKPDFSLVFDPKLLGLAYQAMENELQDYGLRVQYASAQTVDQLAAAWKRTGCYPAGVVFCSWQDRYVPVLHKTLRLLEGPNGIRRSEVVVDWDLGRLRNNAPGVTVCRRTVVLNAAAERLVRFIRRGGRRNAVLFINERGSCWGFPGHGMSLFIVYWMMHKSDPSFDLHLVIRPAYRNNRYVAGFREETLPYYLRRRGNAVMGNVNDTLLARALTDTDVSPAFRERLSALRGYRTWIFDNDADADRALTWAAANGIRIPEDVECITLENAPAHLYRGLTYCGPDWRAIGHQMAHAIIGDVPVKKSRRGFLAAHARIIERLTTR